MNIVVAIKLVPDLVEELAINESGSGLDTSWLRLIVNESDDHAIEQAILLKEGVGGQVTIIAPSVEGVDDLLYTAAAKGADRLIKLVNNFEEGVSNQSLSYSFAKVIQAIQPDLVLTGVQAHNDLDGALGPRMAAHLDMPYVGYVAGVEVKGPKVNVRKEFPGGLVARMEVKLPAVLGIQAAEKPPRYVPISRVRQAMKTATLEEVAAEEAETSAIPVRKMYQPEASQWATILDGEVDEVVEKLLTILKEAGVL